MKVGSIIQLQRPVYYVLLGGISAVVLLSTFGRQQIMAQLDTWKLLPRPEKLTELYFSTHANLPTKYHIGSVQKISFTIHNLEYQTTQYRYTLLAKAGDKEQVLGGGTARLPHDASQNVAESFTVPALDDRMEIQVRLEYAGTNPKPETQKIHYWINTIEGV